MKLNSRDAQVCHRVWEWGEEGVRKGKGGGRQKGRGVGDSRETSYHFTSLNVNNPTMSSICLSQE